MKKIIISILIFLFISQLIFSNDTSADLNKKIKKTLMYDMFLYGSVIVQKNILFEKPILDDANKNFVFVGFFGGALIPQKNGFIYKFGIATWLTPQWKNEDSKFLPQNFGISFSSRFGYKHRFETIKKPIITTFDLSVLGGIKFTTDQIGLGSSPDIELLNLSIWMQHDKYFFTTESVFIYTPYYSKKNETNLWKINIQTYIKTGYSVFNIERFFRNIYGKMDFNIEISNEKFFLAKESANPKETFSPSFELGWYIGIGCLEFGGGIGIDPKNFVGDNVAINKALVGVRLDIGDIKFSTAE